MPDQFQSGCSPANHGFRKYEMKSGLFLISAVLLSYSCSSEWELPRGCERFSGRRKDKSVHGERFEGDAGIQSWNYEFGQASEIHWDAPTADPDSLEVLVFLGPEKLGEMLMAEDGVDVVSMAKANRILLAIKRSGSGPKHLDVYLEIYRNHPNPDIVNDVRERLVELQKHNPWKTALFALHQDDEPGLLGFLGRLEEVKATWEKDTDLSVKIPHQGPDDDNGDADDGDAAVKESAADHEREKASGDGSEDEWDYSLDEGLQDPRAAVLTRIFARVLEREKVVYAQPEMMLNITILALHAPDEPIRQFYPRLRTGILWNRLTMALAEAGRLELARDFSVPPTMVRIYAVARELYAITDLLKYIQNPPDWAQRKLDEVFLRVSHLYAGYLTHECVPEPSHRVPELKRVSALLARRLGELIDGLEKTIRLNEGKSAEDVNMLFQNLMLMRVLSEAAGLFVALDETPRCDID